MLLIHINSDDSAFIYNTSPITAGDHSKPIFTKFWNKSVTIYHQCLHSARILVFQKYLILLHLLWLISGGQQGPELLKFIIILQLSSIKCNALSGTVLLLKTGTNLRLLKQEGKKKEKKKEERDLVTVMANFHDKAVTAGAWRCNRIRITMQPPQKKNQDHETRSMNYSCFLQSSAYPFLRHWIFAYISSNLH